MSSGQMVSLFNLDVECHCGFSGAVEAWEDPEIAAWGWRCPACLHDHEDSTYDEPESTYDTLEEWFIEQ